MRQNRLFQIGSAMVLAALLAVPAMAQAPLHGRVSYDTTGAMIKGRTDADWSYAPVNTLVLQDDTLWVDNGGTLEVEFAGGIFLRMADGSKADISQLSPNPAVKAWTGSFYVQRLQRSDSNFSLRTPACVVTVDENTQVRVDILDNGATTVSVRWGQAVIGTDVGAPTAVPAGNQAFVDPGLLASLPQPFDRSYEDSFDAWNRDRAKFLVTGTTTTPSNNYTIPSNTLGARDLDRYGEWIYVDNTPYWRPTVVADYTPYRQGRWSYVPSYGYSWAGDYPFSYVTGHYGRWNHHAQYGWIWTYRSGWSGGWVAGVRYGDYFAWSPLDIYDRPCSYGQGYFRAGNFDMYYNTTSYCSASDLLYGSHYNSYPWRPQLANNIVADQVNIWNITINNSGNYYDTVTANNRPYQGAGAGDHRAAPMQVRNYSPRRVIRGPDIAGPAGVSAAARIQNLESTRGRTAFATINRTGGSNARTSVADSNRSARTRSVSVNAAPSWEASRANRGTGDVATRSTQGRATPTDSAIPSRGSIGRTNDAASSRTTRSRSITTPSAPERGPSAPAAVRPGQSEGSVASRSRGVTGGTRTDSATPSRATPGISAPQRTVPRTGAWTGSRSTGRTPSTVATPERSQAPSRGTQGITGIPSRTPSAPSQGITGIPSRTPDRTPRVGTAPPARTQIPSAPSRSRVNTAPRTSTPAPSRTYTPSRTSVAVPSRPTVTAPSRITVPSTPSRSSISVVPRSSSRSYSAPSRSTTTTRPQYTPPPSTPAPSRSSVSTVPSRPSVQYQAPAPSVPSRPSVSVPSRSPAPSIGTPSRGSSRSYTAPPSASSNSSRSYSAPPASSSNSSRSYSAPPSSSSGSSRGVSAGSSGTPSRGRR